ncbi:MAG: SGNH/GDSL hydrolase family protein [Acidobacteriota bacterium]|nr:SGNH/GDSL hydrolase family protein [Acidobacteriota bacterium]
MTETEGSDARARSRLRLRFGRLLLLFGGILVALLIAEAGLRVSGFRYFNPYMVDQDVGYSLRPGAEGWWEKEGMTYIKINRHGFRDREHTIAKPPGTLRIAVLGDSQTEAFQVPLEKAFWSVMERKLQECPQGARSKVEVLSFGVSGFSTARELILLQKHVWQYSPDVIVLVVTIGNDVRDNSPTLNNYAGLPLPYFVFRDGKLILDDSLLAARNRSLRFRLRQSFVGKSFYWLQNNLRLVGLVYKVREAYQSSSQTSARQQQQGLNIRRLLEPGVDNEVFRDLVSPDWNDAWRVTEGLILQMRDEVQLKGAKFLVVTGSMGVQVYPDADARQEYMDRVGISSLFSPDYRFKALGEHAGFKVLNLAPPLQDYADRNKVFLHGANDTKGRGHWNEFGHRIAGELIAQELCSWSRE